MAIIDNIERLQDAKAAIKAAIEQKGGSVSGTLDKFAAAILALPEGGEPSIVTKTASASNGLTLTFSGLPDKPKYWAVIATGNYTTSYQYCIVAANGSIGTGNRGVVGYRSSGTYAHSNITASYSNGTLTLTSPSNNSSGGQWRASYQLIVIC